MRRRDPLPSPAEALAIVARLYAEGEGLKLMRHLLPEGASEADALSFRNRLKRDQRRRSGCLEALARAEGEGR